MKKFFSYLLVFVMLAASLIVPPFSVMADGPTSSSFSIIGDDVDTQLLMRAADACIGGIDFSREEIQFGGAFNLDIHERKTLTDELNLNFQLDKTKLYDSYLEQKYAGKYTDGKIYCKEIGNLLYPTLLQNLNYYTYAGIDDIICGSNGRDGLFSITSSNAYAPTEPFPDYWWGLTDDRLPATKQDCLNAMSQIRFYANVDGYNPGDSLPTMPEVADSGNPPTIFIDLNNSFRFSDYFSGWKDKIDIDSADRKLLFWTLMTTGCASQTKTLAEYNELIAHNAVNNYKPIYYNNNISYILPSSGSRHVGVIGFNDLATENSMTCSEIADMLSAENAGEAIATDNAALITQCVASVKQNVTTIKTVISYTKKITERSKELLDDAKALVGGSTPTGRIVNIAAEYVKHNSQYELGFWSKDMEQYESMIKNQLKADEDFNDNAKILDSISKLIQNTKDTERRVLEYYLGKNGLENRSYPTQEETTEMTEGVIKTYESNYNSFKSNYTDKLDAYSYLEVKEDGAIPALVTGPAIPGEPQNGYQPRIPTADIYKVQTEIGQHPIKCLGEQDDTIFRPKVKEIEQIIGVELSLSEYNPTSTISNDDPGTIDAGVIIGETDPCFHTAESMGWILCPVLKGIVNAAEGLYEEAVEPFLVVNTQLFNTNNGAYSAWRVFANIANVVAVIFLLFIVFSQITGVGIDNYGIKKSLPKIIVAAILINLSYIICQLAVDSSNIIGQSLESLLTGIGNGLPYNSSTIGAVIGETPSAMFKVLLNTTLALTGLIAGLGVTGAVLGVAEGVATAGVIGGVFEGIGIIIPILVGVLGVLIAVLTFFVMLGLRQIAVILLVVISPVAFVCYMLPNTRNLFKKWWNILKAMLILYPMAGLTIGGCHLVSSILLSTNATQTNFLFYLLNMIVMALPLLLIPSLVSKSMGALGDITSKIRDFGQGVRQRAQRRASYGMSNARRFAEGRAGFQAARQEAAERQKYRVGRASDRLARRRENSLNRKAQRLAGQGRELSASDQARLDRYKRTQADWTTDREATRDRVSDRSFYAGYANQRRSESSSKNKDTRQWADSGYVSAQEKKADTSRRMTYEDTMQWNHDEIAKAALDDNRNKLNERMARAIKGVVVKDQSVLDRQAENQRNLDLANNNLDVTPQITEKYAQNLAKQRFDTAQQKMYSEELTNLNRRDVELKLNDIVKGEGEFAHDTNYLQAVLGALRSKGGSVEIAQALQAVDSNTPPEIASELNTFAATMSEQAIVKQYGKDIANGKTQATNFSDWLKTDGATYIENNPKLMAGMDKDQLDFFGKVYAGNSGIVKNTASVLYAATGASTSDEQAKAGAIIDTYVKNTSMDQRAKDLRSIPIAEFVKLQPETFNKLVGGLGPNGELTGVGSNDVEMEATLHQIHSVIGQAGGNTLAALDPKIRAALESRFGPFGATASSGTPTAGQPQGGNNNPTTGTEVFGEDGGGI